MTFLWLTLSGYRLYHMTNTGGKMSFSFCVNLQINIPDTITNLYIVKIEIIQFSLFVFQVFLTLFFPILK